MTRAGMTIIENEIRSVLAQATQNGGLSEDVPFTVSAPDPVTMPDMYRAARRAETFTFEARLANAVSTVVIKGTVEA